MNINKRLVTICFVVIAAILLYFGCRDYGYILHDYIILEGQITNIHVNEDTYSTLTVQGKNENDAYRVIVSSKTQIRLEKGKKMKVTDLEVGNDIKSIVSPVYLLDPITYSTCYKIQVLK